MKIPKKLMEMKPPESFESKVHTSPMNGEKFWMVLWDKHRRVWRRWDPEKMIGIPEKEWRKGPALHDENYWGGKFKYQTHGRKDTGEQPCIEDLGSPEARSTWKDYIVTKDAKGNEIHGPAPFRNGDERREYMKRYGFRPADRGETWRDPSKYIREQAREMVLRGMERG